VGPRNHVLDGGQIALYEGAVFMGKNMPRHAQRNSAVSYTKMAEPIEMSFGLLTQVGPRKHALGEVHTVTWTNRQILLKCPYAVVMRPVVKLL